MNNILRFKAVIFFASLVLYSCNTPTTPVKEKAAAPPVNKIVIKDTIPLKTYRRYPSISAMLDSSNDFSSNDSTFKIISENPLHIQISKINLPGVSIDVLRKEAMSSIVYVAYQAFTTTPIQEITITAVPVIFDNINNKKIKFEESARYTATIKKDRAQQVMQQMIGTSHFDDLLGVDLGNGEYFSDGPSPSFNKLKSVATITETLALLTKDSLLPASNLKDFGKIQAIQKAGNEAAIRSIYMKSLKSAHR